MTAIRVFLSRLAALIRRGRRDAEIDEEMRAHLDLLAEDHVRGGLSPADARLAARRDFGSVAAAVEQYRDQRGFPFVDTLVQDVRYALRLWRRAPGFTAIVVSVVALGIGANSAIFNVVDALFLRRLPVHEPSRLAFFTIESAQGDDDSFSYGDYVDYGGQRGLFTGICASGGLHSARLTIGGPAAVRVESVKAEIVSGTFFPVLGVAPAAGRLLTDGDDRRQHPEAVAVLSYAFWKTRFALDPRAVGRTLTLNDTPLTVVGVAPEGFTGFEIGAAPDLWFPLQMLPAFAHIDAAQMNDRGWTWLRLMGRLAPGATLASARAGIDVLYRRRILDQVGRRSARLGTAFTARERQSMLDRRIGMHAGGTGWTRLRAQFGEPLVIVMIAVGVVLLIACANVASLLLARGAARQKEIAVRLAIGAGRRRIVQQLLTESLLLAAAGGAAGAMLARWSGWLLVAYFPQPGIELDLRTSLAFVAFTAAASALAGLVFGLVPALRATRVDVAVHLEKARATAHRSRLVLNRALVVAQVALSLLLLVGAGLFVRTFQNLRGMDAGFDRTRVTTFRLDTGGYPSARRDEIYHRVLDRAAALPGVRSATLSSFGLLGENTWGQRIAIPGYAPQPTENMRVNGQIAGPRFFETMVTPVVLGRDFTADDAQRRDRTRGVAIVNETLARKYFPDGRAIGRRIDTPAGDSMEIVGVVADMKYQTLRAPSPPTFYVPAFQAALNADTTFLVRGTTGADVGADTIRRAVADVDPAVLVLAVRPLDEVVDASVAQERFVAQVAAVFGLFALALASIGVYGLISYSVTQRARDIAIRIALGAAGSEVIRMVLREDLVLLVAGFAIGLPAAFAASRLVQSLLFGVTAGDPATLAVAAAVMGGVGLAAGYLPARRAARLDPLTALKCE